MYLIKKQVCFILFSKLVFYFIDLVFQNTVFKINTKINVLLYCLSIKNAKVNIENRTCNVALFKVTYHNLLGRQFCFHTFRVQYN